MTGKRTGLLSDPLGYLPLVSNLASRRWHRILSSSVLTLNGYVAFNLPRTVSALGGSLLMGIVAMYAYILATGTVLPIYLVVYVAALILGCVIAAGAIGLASNPLCRNVVGISAAPSA